MKVTRENELECSEFELDRLLQQSAALNAELSELSRSINLQRDRIALIKYGVGLGSIVWKDGKKYRVLKIEHVGCGGKPWIMGGRELKGGGFSKSPRHLFVDWSNNPED